MARDRYVVSDDNSDSASVVRPRRIEVLAGAERRRKWADETKIAIVAEALTPGTVVSDVARRHDVVPSQVFGWMRKFRAEALAIIDALNRLTEHNHPQLGTVSQFHDGDDVVLEYRQGTQQWARYVHGPNAG